LSRASLRCTSARLAVLRKLMAATSPVSHAEVAEGLEADGFDRVTVYRNLVEFAEAGLANRVDLGDHTWRFELRRSTASHAADHPHFVCLDCGAVSCLPDVSVNIKQRRGAKQAPLNDVTEVVLRGHCGCA
jgi:Fur family transcriptional regulator, ferric uptake regulator